MRNWHVEVYLVNETDQSLMPATVFEKVTYKLHESFGKRATQGMSDHPLRDAGFHSSTLKRRKKYL